MQDKQVLNIATEVGYMMLKYGGEVYRAEQCARYICKFYGITQVDVFAIPNSIVVTIEIDGDFTTKTRRITSNEVDLAKVEALNELSRRIGRERPAYDDVVAALRKIEKIQPHPPILRMIAAALVSLGFCILFKGSVAEAIVSGLIGFVTYGALYLLGRSRLNPFLRTATCSFVLSALSYLANVSSAGVLRNQPMLAGALMILVPGLALANCMRDLMAQDYVAGVTKFTEALMTALATALGVAIVIFATHPM